MQLRGDIVTILIVKLVFTDNNTHDAEGQQKIKKRISAGMNVNFQDKKLLRISGICTGTGKKL